MDTNLSDRLLASFPVLAQLPPELLAGLLSGAAVLRVPHGTALFEAGSPCRAFPLVLEGTVRVMKQAPSGRELELYRVAPGESCILTSGCLLGNTRYPARGVADGDVTAVVLPQPLFDRIFEGSPAFRQYVFALFAERLANLMQLVEEVAFRRLDQRLAALLLRRGPLVAATHQAIADELGSVREIVSRLLKSFEAQGAVRLGREQVHVVDPAALQALAQTH